MRQGPGETRARIGRRAATIFASLALVATALPAQDVTQVSSTTVTTRTSTPDITGVIDSKAVNALRSMGAYLRTLKSFGVDVKGARDEVMADGQKILITGSVKYLVRTPDRLRAEINTDRKQRTIYYNGKTMTLYAPRMHYYSTVNAPPTNEQLLDSLRDRGVELPIADLFLWGTARDGVKDLNQARYIGPSSVDGIQTDQYAFRQEGTDWQIWIEQGSRPLPRRLVITSVDKPSEPQYFATMMWDLTANTDDANFVFTPPKDAKQIPWNKETVAAARKAP